MSPAYFKAIRLQSGLFQKDLARLLRIHPIHVSKLETGAHAISPQISLLMELLRDGIIYADPSVYETPLFYELDGVER